MKPTQEQLFRRKKYIINLDFQARTIGLIIGLVSLLSLGFMLATQYYLNINFNALTESGLMTSALAEQLTHIEKSYLNRNLLTLFFSVIGIITALGILLTHRIAGPLFALQRRMTEIIEKGPTALPLRVRKTDEFQELIEIFNTMMHRLVKQISEKDEEIERLQHGYAKKSVLKKVS